MSVLDHECACCSEWAMLYFEQLPIKSRKNTNYRIIKMNMWQQGCGQTSTMDGEEAG